MNVVKCIFLDIDGVLAPFGIGKITKSHMERLATVINKTGAKIVVSSDWRCSA